MAPITVQAMVAAFRRGTGMPVAVSTPARNSSAKGRPNRKRTCVAPTVPRVAVSSFCMALRSTCPPQATTVNTAHNHGMAPAPPTPALHPALGHSTELPAAQQRRGRQTLTVHLALPWFDKLTTGLEMILLPPQPSSLHDGSARIGDDVGLIP